ncbi:MAG: hypothetical protein KIT22_02570 [Verrucomicrobiae bacterium]|nr:hypothetical protein [Verrucomicrobiae bacterium]
MDFLKKHYEKLILSVVLLVVAGTAFWLVQKVDTVRTTLAEQLNQTVGGKKKALKPADLTNDVVALQQLSQPYELELSKGHSVFNPIRWIRGTDGAPRPDPGLDLASVVKLVDTKPLNLLVVYLGPTGTGDPYRYQFNVTREYDKKVSNRRSITVSLVEGTKNDWFYLREVHGPKDSAGEVVIELIEGGERATLQKDKPFARVRGYQADLKYEAKDFPARRVDDSINIAGTAYKIVAIGKDEVVVSAPNGTRTTIKKLSTP